MKKIKKAIIPAAGLGTRFLPATKAMPKEMLPIIDKHTIQYIVEEAARAGIEDTKEYTTESNLIELVDELPEEHGQAQGPIEEITENNH
uniref:sugar phosphate nucleotidyltransferase n=1 Tax=Staphylococcus aureus TaxID=1280 RepID=UPI003B9F7611